MEEIKKYSQVDKDNESVHFRISKIEDYYSERAGEPDTPHRHDYYTILLLRKGKGTHNIDFSSHALDKNQLYFINPGQVHQVIEEEQSYGYTLVFSEEFLLKNNFKTCFLMELGLFDNHGNQPMVKLKKKEFKTLDKLCNQLLDTFKSKPKHHEQLLGSYLNIFLIESHKYKYKNTEIVRVSETSNSLATSFRQLVEQHYSEWHSATEYAEALNITADHLNRAVKPVIGKTTKQYIHSRIEIAAKRMLYFTDLSNKEISYALGFQEPSNFSTFFKKNAGISPRDFKKQYSQNIGNL